MDKSLRLGLVSLAVVLVVFVVSKLLINKRTVQNDTRRQGMGVLFKLVMIPVAMALVDKFVLRKLDANSQ